MTVSQEAVFVLVLVWGIIGWLLHWREDAYRRDLLADLLQVIHDYDLDRDDLRRSLGYDEIESRLEKWNDE